MIWIENFTSKYHSHEYFWYFLKSTLSSLDEVAITVNPFDTLYFMSEMLEILL